MLPAPFLRRPAAVLIALGLAGGGLLAAPASQAAPVPASTLARAAAPSEPATPATPSKPARLRYVAMGDSYASAAGVQPTVPGSPETCARSTQNFAHVIAARTGARLTDVTCSGAVTGDYFRSQDQGVPRQLNALDKRTRLVTMTIGGNDSGVFVGAIEACVGAAAATAGTGSPCKDQYGSRFVDTIRTTTSPSLVKALRAVHRNAPRARVAILGYPQILPASGGCYPQMPVATGDVPYLHHLEAVLNKVVRRAAKRTGSVYVNTPKASVGHDACKALGTRWIEPIIGGTNPVVVHPNAFGESEMARVAMNRLRLR